MFIIRKKHTMEVHTISDKNDTVPPDGYELLEAEGNIKDLKLAVHPCFCKFKNNNFVENQVAIDKDKKDKATILTEEKIKEEKDKITRKQAIKNLKDRGELPQEFEVN